jgi:twitching motility two-component system response regulator PilG
MDESGTLRKVNPRELLKHFVSNYKTGCLRVFSSSVTWSIYINQGRITYATHSIAPDDRLRCHLQRLCDLKFVERTLAHLDRVFDNLRSRKTSLEALEYKAIFSLVVARYLNSEQACLLAETLTKETLTLFLLVTAGNYELRNQNSMPYQSFANLT